MRENTPAILPTMWIIAIIALVVLYLLESSPSSGSDTTSPSSVGGPLSALASAMATFEHSSYQNNPGGLRPNAIVYPGQVGVTSGGFALFDSYDSGLAAMQSLLQSKISAHPDWDFYDLTSNWVYGKDVPPAGDPGNANAYADYVAQQFGTDATSSLDETFGG